VSADVELPARPDELLTANVRVKYSFGFHRRSCDDFAVRIEDDAATRIDPAVHLCEVFRLECERVRDIVLAHGLTTANDENAAFLRDVPERGQPRLATIPGWSDMHLFAPGAERIPGERHVVLPADQSAYATERQRVDLEVAAVA